MAHSSTVVWARPNFLLSHFNKSVTQLKIYQEVPPFQQDSHSLSRVCFPIRFAVNRSPSLLPGTDLYVWGNDWRNGLVNYTIDGEPVFNQLIDLHTTDSTAGRCRFTWFTKTGLTPTTHTFQFNLTGPSLDLINTTQGYLNGSAANLGLQFFYYTYVIIVLPLDPNSSLLHQLYPASASQFK